MMTGAGPAERISPPARAADPLASLHPKGTPHMAKKAASSGAHKKAARSNPPKSSPPGSAPSGGTLSERALAGEPRLVGSSSIFLVGAFLAILVLLHFLEPEFDPSWRMISEYEIGRYGWLMTVAFLCWGLGVLDLQMVLSHSLQTLGGKVGRWWLVVIGVAMMAAGVFKTNAITDNTVSLDNTLHTLAGAIVIITFPVAATLVARSLLHNPRWAAARGWLVWGTVLCWAGMVIYFGSIIVSGIINPGAGRVGPQVLQGWPNRLMVVIYSAWMIVIARYASRLR